MNTEEFSLLLLRYPIYDHHVNCLDKRYDVHRKSIQLLTSYDKRFDWFAELFVGHSIEWKVGQILTK